MNLREIGRQRGRTAGENARKGGFADQMNYDLAGNARLFPTLGKGFDLVAAVLAWDQKRLAATPDATEFPETRGLVDRHLGEREGFCEGTGFTPAHAAWHFSSYHYFWKHVNAHHLARYDLADPPQQCTNVFFPQTEEGGVVISDNRDDVMRAFQEAPIRDWKAGTPGKDSPVYWVQGGVSSSILLDEEPKEIFPANPHDLMPPECLEDVKQIVAFMDRYKEFWGPGNQLWVDKQFRGVMVEKANIRVAYRWPTQGGAICVTACSYIDPGLNAFKRSRLKEVMRLKGENERTCIDYVYSEGCDQRQHRLLALTNAEAKRGATLWGALNVVADTAVPFPARICLAGEKGIPDKEPQANWSLTQHAMVITGPNRRSLYRSIQSYSDPKPVYGLTPKLMLGAGVAMKPEWRADVDAGRCELVEAEKAEPMLA